MRTNLENRLSQLESKLPPPDELEKRRRQEFLSRFSVPELKRLEEIILRTDRDRSKLTAEETAFLEELEAKYGTLRDIE